MCEFCTKHGDGHLWYQNVANYANDLAADLQRRAFVSSFHESTILSGIQSLGRLEGIFARKGRIPAGIKQRIEHRAQVEHFGQVLPIEHVEKLLSQARSIVSMPCACRWATDRTDVRCCYGIAYGPEPWYRDLDMGHFGSPPRSGLQSLTADVALTEMRALEADGAVHTIWTMMTPFIGVVCNCEIQHCLGLRSLQVQVETLAPGETEAAVTRSLCNGCGLCVESCPFDAIAAHHDHGEVVAEVSPQKCWGCGLCRNTCPSRALVLVPRGGALGHHGQPG